MRHALSDLTVFAGLQVSLPLMRSIVNSAPQSLAQLTDAGWQKSSVCAQTLAEAEKATAKAPDELRFHWNNKRQSCSIRAARLPTSGRTTTRASVTAATSPPTGGQPDCQLNCQ